MRKMRKSAAVALTAAMAVTSLGVIPAMADETTTISVMVWDRGDAPQGMTVEANKMSEWINEQVADLGLQVEFVAVPRSTSEDVLTTMMTGGNAPDIIFSYDQNVFLNYANLGGLADLTDAYENIGTTITANLAALTANSQAKRAALAHFVFNVFGVIWVLIIFHPFMVFVNWVVDTFFHPGSAEVAISYKLSAFHSIFNICNVCLLIWGVKLIERTVCAIIRPKEEDEEPRLRFITGGMLSTAELSILQARKEIHLFSERIHRMFGMVQDLLHTEKDDDFNKLFSRIEKYENISDNMELEIANYLNQVSEGRLSSESKLQIRAMLREVTEIESIGDSCYNLARTISRKRQTNQDFTEKQYEHIHFMMKLTNDALSQMIVVVEKPEHQSIDVNKSFNIENEINNYRNQLKNQNILDVNNKEYDYQMGVYYMDIIAECEKLGDYVVNVVEASSDVKEKKAS